MAPVQRLVELSELLWLSIFMSDFHSHTNCVALNVFFLCHMFFYLMIFIFLNVLFTLNLSISYVQSENSQLNSIKIDCNQSIDERFSKSRVMIDIILNCKYSRGYDEDDSMINCCKRAHFNWIPILTTSDACLLPLSTYRHISTVQLPPPPPSPPFSTIWYFSTSLFHQPATPRLLSTFFLLHVFPIHSKIIVQKSLLHFD